MRKDMKKVLVTEGRKHSTARNHDVVQVRRQKLDLFEDEEGNLELMDHVPSGGKSGISQKSWVDKKEFGEHLAPLYRYIQSQVGRPWDKVFSEIREVNSPDNPVNNHIYDHMWNYVEINCALDEQGKVYRKAPYEGRIYADFYVHPKDGLLKRTPRARRRQATLPGPDVWHEVGNKLYAKKDDGTWFEVTVTSEGLTQDRVLFSSVEEQLKEMGFTGAIKEYGFRMKVWRKANFSLRTLSKRDLKHLGLR